MGLFKKLKKSNSKNTAEEQSKTVNIEKANEVENTTAVAAEEKKIEKADAVKVKPEPEKKEKEAVTKAQKSAPKSDLTKTKKTQTAAKKVEKETPSTKKTTATVKKSASTAISENKSDKTKKATKPKAINNADIEIEEYEEVKPEKFTGKFDIKKTKDNRYVFNLYSTNHVIVATSQVYSSAQSAMIGINSVIANAHKTPIEDQTLKNYEAIGYPKWEIYLDKGGQYRFKLNASNGSCVCHSQGYTSKTNCKKGIESIIKCSRNPEIDKSYLKKNDK